MSCVTSAAGYTETCLYWVYTRHGKRREASYIVGMSCICARHVGASCCHDAE